MKNKIEGFDIICALGEVNERLLEFPSRARYRAKRLGVFSAAAMLLISVSAVIVFFASVVFSGAGADSNWGDSLTGGSGSSAPNNSPSDGADGGSGELEDSAAPIESEIRISKSGALLNFEGTSGKLVKGEGGSVRISVILGDSQDIPSVRVHYLGTGAVMEILTPEIKDGTAVFTTNDTPEAIDIFSESFPTPIKLIFSDAKDYVTFIYENK